MYLFHKDVEKILLESGWFPGRKIDVTNYQEYFKKEGYPWFYFVQHFLSEFGDLKLFFVTNNGNKDLVHFDAVKAMRDFDFIWIREDYSPRLNNMPLCVIGQAYNNHMTILMDSDGKVYGGFDDSLYFIGDSGETAIENICLKLHLDEIK